MTCRAWPFQRKLDATETYSRVVEFAIDEDQKTVAEVWSYQGSEDERFYSPFLSDADQLPQTGNILITDGGRMVEADGQRSQRFGQAHHFARIVEVTHQDQPEKVFELIVGNPKGQEAGGGWSVYRAERLPSLEPVRP